MMSVEENSFFFQNFLTGFLCNQTVREGENLDLGAKKDAQIGNETSRAYKT